MLNLLSSPCLRYSCRFSLFKMVPEQLEVQYGAAMMFLGEPATLFGEINLNSDGRIEDLNS